MNRAVESNGKKKTLTPEAVVAGLKLCGFTDIHSSLFLKLSGKLNWLLTESVELQNSKSAKRNRISPETTTDNALESAIENVLEKSTDDTNKTSMENTDTPEIITDTADSTQIE